MLSDISSFFGDVTPQGAAVLLLMGLLSGFGLHDVALASWNLLRFWYDRNHDDSRNGSNAP